MCNGTPRGRGARSLDAWHRWGKSPKSMKNQFGEVVGWQQGPPRTSNIPTSTTCVQWCGGSTRGECAEARFLAEERRREDRANLRRGPDDAWGRCWHVHGTRVLKGAARARAVPAVRDGYVGGEWCCAGSLGRSGGRRRGLAFGARDGAARGVRLAWCCGGRAAVGRDETRRWRGGSRRMCAPERRARGGRSCRRCQTLC